ncbi:MAG: hypothetical protein NTY03_06770 [Candidatus Bathyarchaeota archaeon]|nr:hypothetical protein [Candidatus Bathyarchaeota archaeon]
MNHRLTAMRNGVYAMLAVIVGVMLVGMLPGQLSNIASLTVNQTFSLQTGGTQSIPNKTTTNTTGLISQLSSTNTTEDTVKTDRGPTAEPNIDYSFSDSQRKGANDPYLDYKYYGLWGVGLVAAVVVYFTSKRILG